VFSGGLRDNGHADAETGKMLLDKSDEIKGIGETFTGGKVAVLTNRHVAAEGHDVFDPAFDVRVNDSLNVLWRGADAGKVRNNRQAVSLVSLTTMSCVIPA